MHGGGRKFQPFSLRKIRKEALAMSAAVAQQDSNKED